MKIAIIGGGIAGLSAAIALQHLEADIEVYEAAPVLAPAGAGLVLAANAVKALEALGVASAAIGKGKRIDEVSLLDKRGRALARTSSLKVQTPVGTIGNFAIHRADLQEVLLELLPKTPINTGKRISSFQQDDKKVFFSFEDGSKAEADYLIAGDGIHSVLRQQLLPGALPRYAGYTCWRAVVEGREDVSSVRTTETWGPGRRFGIVPLAGNRLYWFATLNTAQPNDPVCAAFTTADLQRTFEGFHDPIPQILSRTPDSHLIWNDILDIRPIVRFAFGRILLIGDAAHATTPNMGQGACQALEDSARLQRLTKEYTYLPEAFKAFEQDRLARTAWVVNTSRQIGALGQWENPLAIKIRNGLMRLIPAGVQQKQLEKLFAVDFD